MMETSGTLTFPTEDEATVMSWDWQVRPKEWFHPLGPVLGLLGRRMERKIWSRLTENLETEPARH